MLNNNKDVSTLRFNGVILALLPHLGAYERPFMHLHIKHTIQSAVYSPCVLMTSI